MEKVAMQLSNIALVCCLSVACLAETNNAPGQTPAVPNLKYEAVTFKGNGPAATLHMLYRPGKVPRHPVILMLGTLTIDRPPDWSMGLLADGYMLVAFSVAHPPDSNPARRPQWLVFDERFAHSYVLGGHRAAIDAHRIIDCLVNRGEVNREKIGWIGSSSTGIPGLAVATQGPRLAAVVVFVSTGAYAQWLNTWQTNGLWRGKTNQLWPETKELLQYDPIRHVAAMYPTAVLMVNGGEDKVVDPATARAFVAAAKPFYENDPDRLQLVIYENFGHNLPGDVVKLYAEHWFHLHMHPTNPPPQPTSKPGTFPDSVQKTQINASSHKDVMGAGK
jgi:dienelactone hydrolase